MHSFANKFPPIYITIPPIPAKCAPDGYKAYVIASEVRDAYVIESLTIDPSVTVATAMANFRAYWVTLDTAGRARWHMGKSEAVRIQDRWEGRCWGKVELKNDNRPRVFSLTLAECCEQLGVSLASVCGCLDKA